MQIRMFKNIVLIITSAILLCNCTSLNKETKDRYLTSPFPPLEDIKNELSQDVKVESVYLQGSDTLVIDFNPANNLTANLVGTSAKNDVLKILSAVKEMSLGYGLYKIRGIFPLADEYGNTEEKVVIYLIYKREKIQRINFEGMKSENVFKIADVKEIHPQFE